MGIVADIFANALARRQSAIEADRIREESRQTTHFALMGEMTAAMAHELSHSLGAVISNAQAAQKILGYPKHNLSELRDVIGDVIAGGRRAAAYVEKVRSIFKKSQSEGEAIQIAPIFSSIYSLMRAELTMKDINLSLEVKLGSIVADRIGLEQILINLIRNATDVINDASPADRSVELRASRVNDYKLAITVSDTGKGVDSNT